MANDGITPSYGTAKEIKEKLNIPVFCIIRPRGGNYIFDKNEINIMLDDIFILVKYVKIDGIVIGCLIIVVGGKGIVEGFRIGSVDIIGGLVEGIISGSVEGIMVIIVVGREMFTHSFVVSFKVGYE